MKRHRVHYAQGVPCSHAWVADGLLMIDAHKTHAKMHAERGNRGPGGHHEGHIVLCGLDGLGFRTLEELRRMGEEVVVISAPGEQFVARARRQGISVIEGSYREEHVLRAAGL